MKPHRCRRAEIVAPRSRLHAARSRALRESSRDVRSNQWKILPAVDDDRLPRDERRRRAGEVDDGADDVLRLLIALDRARRDRDVAELLDHLRVLLDALRHREPGRDAVDPHPVLAELLRQRAREGDDGALARHVVEEERNAAKRGAGRDVDDRAATALAHRRHSGAAREEHRGDVDVHHLPPLLSGISVNGRIASEA